MAERPSQATVRTGVGKSGPRFSDLRGPETRRRRPGPRRTAVRDALAPVGRSHGHGGRGYPDIPGKSFAGGDDGSRTAGADTCPVQPRSSRTCPVLWYMRTAPSQWPWGTSRPRCHEGTRPTPRERRRHRCGVNTPRVRWWRVVWALQPPRACGVIRAQNSEGALTPAEHILRREHCSSRREDTESRVEISLRLRDTERHR